MKTKNKVMEYILGLTVEGMKEIGKTGREMVLGK